MRIRRCGGWPALAALVWVALAACGPGAEPLAAPPLAIQGVTVIDGTGAPPLVDAAVVVEGRRIAAVGPASAVDIPEGAQIVDGHGGTLIPGLWDLHVHVSKARANALPLLVAHGVLGVRDLGGRLEEVRRWRAEIAAGALTGPRIVTAGPYLESPENVVRTLLRESVEPEEEVRLPVPSPDAAARIVDSLAAADVDLIKVRTWPDLATFRAIGDAAEEAGLPLAAHTFGLPPDELAAGRVSTIEHFYPVPRSWSAARRDSFYRELAAAGTAIVPTLVTLETAAVRDTAIASILADYTGALDPLGPTVSAFLLADWREQAEEHGEQAVAFWERTRPAVYEQLRAMREAGMAVLPGTDVAVVLVHPGASLHRELELLVREAGMTPLEALVAATGGAAAHAGVSDSLGTIRPGMLADMVLLEADPLAEIRNTRRIRGVVRDGRWLDEPGLAALRDSARAHPAVRSNDWVGEPPPPSVREGTALLERIASAEGPPAVERALGEVDEIAEALEATGLGGRPLAGGADAFRARVESAVNALGYRFLRAERTDDAVAVFRLNARAFPESANVWDSLGEGLLAADDREGALEAYRRSLALDPDNENARDVVERLGG